MEMNNYETLMILTPVLSEEQLAEAILKFKNFLMEKKAEIVHENKMGLKKLAYPIQHKTTGFFQVFEFNASPDVVRALETEYRRDERIIRFATFALDKHGVAYNATQREKEAHKENPKKKEVVA